MNLNERYQGKQIYLLVVPNTGTSKRGWIARVNRGLRDSGLLFRVCTSDANIPGIIARLNSKFRGVFFVNNPLASYAAAIKAIEHKNFNTVLGLQISKHRPLVTLPGHELVNWEQITDE